jgi:hypothetical protein
VNVTIDNVTIDNITIDNITIDNITIDNIASLDIIGTWRAQPRKASGEARRLENLYA